MKNVIVKSFVAFVLVFWVSTNALAKRSELLVAQLEQIRTAYSAHNDSLSYFLTKAESLARAQKDYEGLVEIYRTRGAWQFLSGEHVRALETLIEGVKIGEQKAISHELVIAYYELGTVHSKNKNRVLAREYMDKGLALAQKLKDTSGMADGNNRIGIIFEYVPNLDSALYYYHKSYELNKLAKDSIGLSYSLENLSTIYAQQKNFTLAIQNLREVIVIRKNKNDLYGVSIATINLSEAFLNAQQIDSAIAYALKAEVSGRAINFLDLLQHTYKQLSEMFKVKGQHAIALQYHERYTALKDSIFNENKSKQMAEMSVKFETERKEQQIRVLNKQKTIQRLGLIAAILSLLIMIAVAYFIFKSRKLKEEKLKSEAAFQLQLKEAEARNAMQHERLRISRELHDNIGAHLTFINATVDGMDKSNEKTQQVKDLTNETIRELRKTVWLINKSSVKVEEFVVKLREFLKNIPQVKVVASIEENGATLSAEMITELFRTTQESVNNAIKYSGAEAITIAIASNKQTIIIDIEDNGCGFDVEEQKNKGFGLENMQHRMECISGSYIVSSTKGKGTKITLSAPFQQNTTIIV